MQAALQELSEQNRSLREHQQAIDRRLAELGPPASSAAAGAAVAAAPNASALPNPPPVQNASALPDASASPPGGSVLNTLGNGLRLWGYGEAILRT